MMGDSVGRQDRIFYEFDLEEMVPGHHLLGRVTRWEHEHILEAVQRRLDENPQAVRQRRETAEHPFGTIKARMGTTHFLMKRLKNLRIEMALHVLAYNLKRVMNIIGIRPLIQAMGA